MMPRITNLFLLLLTALTSTALLAQPESESPYSSSESGEIADPSLWYQSPFLLVGLLIFGAVIIYLVFKGRRKA